MSEEFYVIIRGCHVQPLPLTALFDWVDAPGDKKAGLLI